MKSVLILFFSVVYVSAQWPGHPGGMPGVQESRVKHDIEQSLPGEWVGQRLSVNLGEQFFLMKYKVKLS